MNIKLVYKGFIRSLGIQLELYVDDQAYFIGKLRKNLFGNSRVLLNKDNEQMGKFTIYNRLSNDYYTITIESYDQVVDNLVIVYHKDSSKASFYYDESSYLMLFERPDFPHNNQLEYDMFIHKNGEDFAQLERTDSGFFSPVEYELHCQDNKTNVQFLLFILCAIMIIFEYEIVVP